MTKYEQLIQFIINEQEDKARELFHQIVVEKSRDIYESLVDEEDLGEVGGNAVEDMVDEITMDEEGMAEGEGEDEMEVSFDDNEGDDVAMDMDTDGDMDMDMDMEPEGDVEDRVMDLEDALDDLKAQFDALMSQEKGETDDAGLGDEDMGGNEEDLAEAEDKDDESEEDKEAKDVSESKSARKMTEAEWIREYVEKISAPSNTEGADNKSSVVAGKNDMGGTAKNTAQGGTEADPTGPKNPSNAYTKGQSKLKGAGSFENVPGANAGKAFAKKAAPAKGEAAGTNTKSIEG